MKRARPCEVPGCDKTPAWNRKAQAFYRFCFEHGKPGAVPEPTEWKVIELPTVMPGDGRQSMRNRSKQRANFRKRQPPR